MKHVMKIGPGPARAFAGTIVGISLLGSTPAWAVSDCIPSDKIDHTAVPNDQTVLFFMRDHKVWQNTLTSKCVGLAIDPGGFTYTVTVPETRELCARATIHLNRTGQPCLLGEFTPVVPPPTTAAQ